MVSARSGIVRELAEWVGVFAVACGAAFLINTFLLQPYEVPTGSMEDTIEVGDRIVGEKVTRWLDMPVSRGDIVVFKNPDGTSDHDILVKRVIATEGQTVDLRGGRVYVDGAALDEPYVTGQSWPLLQQAPGVAVSFPYTVPAGSVWVMGDNRENSADSRYFGAVPQDSVQAVVVFRYWPLNRLGAVQ